MSEMSETPEIAMQPPVQPPVQSPVQSPVLPQELLERQQPNPSSSDICKNDNAFELLIEFSNNPENTMYSKDIKDAKILYDNAKFYYMAGQLTGALVSFSCTSVLLNSLIKSLPHQELIDSTTNLLQCCLQAVNVLQAQVGSSSSKSKDDEDEETKDWEKICTKIKPLVFSKGSSDCLFFSGVAGLTKEKDLFKSSLIYPLIYPNLYPKASKGLLLYGPPGTGKTYIVKAAVNELQKIDPTVGVVFFSPSPGDLKGKYVGETEKRIEEIFTCASRAACESELGCPQKKKYQAIIFMDEFDAIGPDRSEDTTGLAVNSVNTLLQMMDGIKSKPNVAVIAATNFPWKLDSAILRRFTTQILIDLPSSVDIKRLLDIEIRKVVKFKEQKKFSWCESQQQITEKENTNAIGPSCNFECVEEEEKDLSTIAPYSSFNIDYYSDKEYISGLVNFMANNNFSNSDVSRFMLAAQTNSGQLAVKSNIFYKASTVKDYTNDVYISSLTKPKDKEKAITDSINLLKSFVSQSATDTSYFQLKPPDYLRIEYNGDYYYNIKSLLYKETTIIIDHPSVKDVYVKLHPKTTDITAVTHEMYNNNVLGIIKYEDDGVDEAGTFGEHHGKIDDEIKIPVSIILTFDFYIKQTNTKTDEQTLLPLSRDLINKVFIPLYNNAKTVYTKITELNGFSAETGNKWFQQTYGSEIPVDFSEEYFLNISHDTTMKNMIKPFIKSIFNKCIQPSIESSTKNNFSLKYSNFDFYKFLLLYYLTHNDALRDNNTMFCELYISSLHNALTIVNLIPELPENLSNIIPFILTQNNTSISINFVYNQTNNACLIKISDYIKLIENYDIYNGIFAIVDIDTHNNKYLSIDIEIFKIIFRGTFDDSQLLTKLSSATEKTQLFPEIDTNTFVENCQRLLQLFIDDILSFYKLSKVIYKSDYAKMTESTEYIKTMLTGLTNINVREEEYTINLVELICFRVYENYNFIKQGITSAPPAALARGGSDDIKMSSYMPNNYPEKIGSGKKIKLTKNKLNKKLIKSTKKNRNKSLQINVGEQNTVNSDKNINVQHGGTAYEDFIKFIIGGKSTNIDSIVNKSIFIATTYSYSEISNIFLRKTSVLNSTFFSIYDLFGDANNKTPEKIINDLQKKAQYLPLIFKKISSIGYLKDSSLKSSKTIDDTLINAPQIIWSNISSSTWTLTSVLQGLVGTSATNIKNIIGAIIEGLAISGGASLAASTGQITVPSVPAMLTSLLGATISESSVGTGIVGFGSVMLTLFMLGNLYSLATNQNVTKETILDNFTLITIFYLIAEVQTVDTDDLTSNTPIDIIRKAINDAKQKITWWQSIVNKTQETSVVIGKETIEKPCEIMKYMYNQQDNPEIKNKLTNLNIPIQSFSYALTLVKTTYDKETGRQLRLYDTDKEALLKEIRKKK